MQRTERTSAVDPGRWRGPVSTQPLDLNEPGVAQSLRLYTPRQVARILGLGKTKVYEMMSRGELPVVEFGPRSKRVPAVALTAWTAEHTSAGRAD